MTRAATRSSPTLALEVGPGRVLSGLARRRMCRTLPCQPVGDSATPWRAATEALA